MAKINFDKHIYEGWTVRDFIEELEPQLDTIQNGYSCYRPMKTREEIRKWTAENQP